MGMVCLCFMTSVASAGSFDVWELEPPKGLGAHVAGSWCWLVSGASPGALSPWVIQASAQHGAWVPRVSFWEREKQVETGSFLRPGLGSPIIPAPLHSTGQDTQQPCSDSRGGCHCGRSTSHSHHPYTGECGGRKTCMCGYLQKTPSATLS
jgi:hypothetical protein